MCSRQANESDSERSDVGSIDDMLANVNRFIKSVYRDLSISPVQHIPVGNTRNRSFNTSSSSPTTSPAGRVESASPVMSDAAYCSPVLRRDIDAEVSRINRICDNVNQNLHAVGISINSRSPSPTRGCVVHTRTISRPGTGKRVRLHYASREGRSQISSSEESSAHPIIDLSNSQTETPNSFRRPVSSQLDDDVVCISLPTPPLVDLCTPTDYDETRRPRHGQHLSRRRLYRHSTSDSSSEERPSSIKRRTESSFVPSENTYPKTPEQTAKTDQSRTPFMCPVCMESCLQRMPTSTVCGHVYCKACIERAIMLTKKCPMCNKRITSKNIFRIYL